MTAPPDDTTTDLHAVIAALRAERDAALSEKAALTEELAARTADLLERKTAFDERIEYQAATNDVLKAMSASPGDAQPVFELIVERARDLCDAYGASVWEYDGTLIHLRASNGVSDDPAVKQAVEAIYPMVPSRERAIGRAILDRQIIYIDDYETDPEVSPVMRGATVKSDVLIPLMRAAEPIGGLGVGSRERGGFSDRQIELMKTFAEQAVIAITSAETYRALQTRTSDLQETLDYQTATSNVLKVISSSTFDLQPVLDTVVQTAARLCEADQAVIVRREGELMQLAANHGFPLEYEALLKGRGPIPIDRAPRNVGPRAIREGRVVHVHDAATEPGYTETAITVGKQRTSLGVPLLREGEVIGSILLARQRVEPFTDRQIELVSTFADQAVIAIENTRLLTEQREALEQQTATAEVLQVINASPGNLTPVFEAILEKAHRICNFDMGSLANYDGTFFRAVATRGYGDQAEAMARTPYRPLTTQRALLRGDRLIHIPDTQEYPVDPDDVAIPAFVTASGFRACLMVPLRKDGTLLGFLTGYRKVAGPFSEKQIALLENFAAQAVIAMENARLITETREALEQQTATAEVLQVINASPGDLAPVFDAMLQRATRLCGTAIGSFWSYNGEVFQVLASTIGDTGRTMQPSTNTALWRIAHGESVVQIADVETELAYRVDPVGQMRTRLAGTRTALVVALRKDETLVGAITTGRPEVRPFTDKQIALLKSFAAQAVIAMENARLINEQREALEQQTAISDIFRVINASPGELTPVFSAMLDKALRLCEAASGGFFTYDGEHFRTEATQGVPPALAAFRAKNPPTARRLLERRSPVHNVDLRTDPDYLAGDASRRAVVELGGARTMLNVPLLKDRTVLGFIAIYRQEVRAFSDKQIALVENFAAQAVIAMENARLLQELRARTNELAQRQEELRVTFENMGDGVAMFDETPRLVAWNRKFREILDIPDNIVAERQTYASYIRYLAERGEYGPVDPEEQLRRFQARAGEHYLFERTRPDGRVIEVRHNPVLDGGFVLIFSDITERKRSEEEIREARDAAETALRDLKTAQANLIQAEKMASLGQLTAGIAHEIKNPLNFVNNFAALSVDLLSELKETAAPGFAVLTDKQRAEVEEVSVMLTSNLEKITEHGKRADDIVKAMLEHSRGSSGERRTVDLNALIDEALNLAYHGARAQDQSFNITLERDFGSGIAPIEVNPQDITRVFLNLFSNGFYAATRRAHDCGDAGFVPTLKVASRNAGEAVEIRVRDNGTGIPADIRDKLFQPFFTTKPTGEGTGLGLSISYDIITQQHGGSIAVDSNVGEYTEFRIRLPREP